jgi:hypothetical protein
MRKDDRVRLRHMLDAAEEALSFAHRRARAGRERFRRRREFAPLTCACATHRCHGASIRRVAACLTPDRSDEIGGALLLEPVQVTPLRPLGGVGRPSASSLTGDRGITTVCRHFLRGRCHG